MTTAKIKSSILGIPFVGYGIRVIDNIIRSPLHKQDTASKIDHTEQAINSLSIAFEKLQQVNSTELNEIIKRLDNLAIMHDGVEKRFALMEKNQNIQAQIEKQNTKKNDELFANDHLLDIFYTEFEDRFRGSEKMILERLKEYLPDFENATVDFSKYPVLDIGSGRGEFLQLLKKHDVNAEGLDINIDMVERSNAKGLKASQGDALDFLLSKESQTYGAITGFHIVEHIPFNSLLRIFKAAHQALAKEGFVLFETPNPENIIVGSCAFYMDPSHLHPIPPDLLAFALETVGFRNVEIRRIHPAEEYDAGELPQEFINRFYGPRDYVVLGYK